MEIYIEYVLFDNLIINTLIILITNKILNSNIKHINMALSNVFGTVCAVLMPYMFFINLIVYKLVVGILMVLILQKPKSFKKYLILYLTFLTVTFIIGGSVYAIALLFNIKFTSSGFLFYGYELPISLMIIVVSFYLFVLYKSIDLVKRQGRTNNYMYDVVIENNGKTFCFNAFLDTGNCLYVKNKPVIIVSCKSFLKIFNNINYEKLILGKIDNSEVSDAEYVEVSSVNNKSKMLTFCVDKIEIYKSCNKKLDTIVYNKPKVGLAMKNFNRNFDIILHKDLLGGIL